ncbi:MAG TPA: M20 aminoacylase family protein [Steroidobacteraceae bacterium]|nr:M20 aminoacylase family protein [Steroidobacteraceae bacterium]
MSPAKPVSTQPSPLLARINELAVDMREVRRDLHRHPELAYVENRTASVVAKLLREWGIEVHEGIGKTGVVGVIEGGSGAGGGRAIGLRADMDALPIQETSGAPHASVNAGVAHSCGHDGHTAMLLCAARYLAETRRFNGRVHLLFQPAEEGLAGARAMIEDGLFKRFPCAEVYALHNWPTLPAGAIATRAGPIMGASDRFTITVRGVGGHAAQPHLTTDVVLCAAQIVTGAHTLIARRVDPAATAVLSITRIQGGTSFNVLPAEVQLAGTVRTFDPAVQDKLEATLREWVDLTAKAAGCSASLEYRRIYPATINDPVCAQHALDAAGALFGEALRADSPAATAEDFAFMLQQVPGAYIWVGSRKGDSSPTLHHPSFDFNDEALPAGAALLASLAERRLAG